MNFKNITTIAGLTLLLFSCKSGKQTNQAETIIHSDVTVTQPVQKDISIYKEFQGITLFTQHLQIRAQVTGIITQSFILVGNQIKTSQPIVVIKSREATLLNNASFNGKKVAQMADTLLAFSPGIIDQVLVQQGDFVQQGDLLATCVSQASMRIVVSVPLEENTARFHNKTCTILLPDNQRIPGRIGAALPIANSSDQTKQFLIFPETSQGLSENMHVQVKVKDYEIRQGIFVPKNSVYSNEELTQYWIYQIFHDSLAIKKSIKRGTEIDSLVQVLDPQLSLSELIINSGGYGLPDTALITIIHSDAHEEK